MGSWSFDETSGSTVQDSSGMHNNGKITGATRVTGRSGRALRFDGTNDLVAIPDSPSLDLSSRMTLEAWVQPTALGTAWRTVALKEQGSDLVYGLYAGNDSGLPSVHVNNGSHTMLAGTSSLQLNAWTHVAGVWDGATLRLYVNGTQVRSTPLSGAASQGDQPLYLGGNAVWGEWFQGVIDDVRVWDKALTAAEVLTHAIAAPPLPPVSPKKPTGPSTADLTAAAGDGSGSLTRTATVSDTVAPSRPGKIKVVRRPKGRVVLKWGASKDASGTIRYVVLRGKKVVARSRVAKATVALKGCRGSQVLKVQAVDASGNRSRVRAIRVRC